MFDTIGQRPSRRGSSESKQAAYWQGRAIEDALDMEFSSVDLRNIAAREFIRMNGDEDVDSLVVSMSTREVGAWRSKERNGSTKVPDYFPKLVADTKKRLLAIVEGGVNTLKENERRFKVYTFDQRDGSGNLVTSESGREVSTGYGPESPRGKGNDTIEFVEFLSWNDESAAKAYAFLKSREEQLNA